MDFRAAVKRLAAEATQCQMPGAHHMATTHVAEGMSSDMSMDSTMEDASIPAHRQWGQAPPQTDDLDPAAPGGPAPYNAADPYSQPVVSDQEWLNPQQQKPQHNTPMPHVDGPDEDVTTLHSARLAFYDSKVKRFR